MIQFNPTSKALEIRIIVLIRKYFDFTRAQSLGKLRNFTGDGGIQTAVCYRDIVCSPDRKKTISKIFKL